MADTLQKLTDFASRQEASAAELTAQIMAGTYTRTTWMTAQYTPLHEEVALADYACAIPAGARTLGEIGSRVELISHAGRTPQNGPVTTYTAPWDIVIRLIPTAGMQSHYIKLDVGLLDYDLTQRIIRQLHSHWACGFPRGTKEPRSSSPAAVLMPLPALPAALNHSPYPRSWRLRKTSGGASFFSNQEERHADHSSSDRN